MQVKINIPLIKYFHIFLFTCSNRIERLYGSWTEDGKFDFFASKPFKFLDSFRYIDIIMLLVVHISKVTIYLQINKFLQQHNLKYFDKNKEKKRKKQQKKTFASLVTNIIEVIIEDILWLTIFINSRVSFCKLLFQFNSGKSALF